MKTFETITVTGESVEFLALGLEGIASMLRQGIIAGGNECTAGSFAFRVADDDEKAPVRPCTCDANADSILSCQRHTPLEPYAYCHFCGVPLTADEAEVQDVDGDEVFVHEDEDLCNRAINGELDTEEEESAAIAKLLQMKEQGLLFLAPKGA